MKKRTLASILALCLCLALLPVGTAAAYEPQYTPYADGLYQLGLFRGTGTDADGAPVYELERGASRSEMLVMLIRMLGEEEAALAWEGKHPFTDAAGHWAEAYIGYAYEKGYTKGTGASTFDPGGEGTANMYLTFLLRALGYDDAAGDFEYKRAYHTAYNVGIYDNGGKYQNYERSTEFYRDDCAYTSWGALGCALASKDGTLVEKLIANGVVEEASAVSLGLVGDSTVEGITLVNDAAEVAYTSAADGTLMLETLNASGEWERLDAVTAPPAGGGTVRVALALAELPKYPCVRAILYNSSGIPLSNKYEPLSNVSAEELEASLARTVPVPEYMDMEGYSRPIVKICEYDKQGRLIAALYESPFSSYFNNLFGECWDIFEYDETGRLIARGSSTGHYLYERGIKESNKYDPYASIYQMQYDDAGNLIGHYEVTRGKTTTYADSADSSDGLSIYSETGKILSICDEKGRTLSTYEYRNDDSLSKHTAYTYADVSDDPLADINSGSNSTCVMDYDENERLLKAVLYNKNGEHKGEVSYTYDEYGNLEKEVYSNGYYLYVYLDRNHIAEIYWLNNNSELARCYGFGYDDNGNGKSWPSPTSVINKQAASGDS